MSAFDWNGDGKIDDVDDFLDYMIYQEVTGDKDDQDDYDYEEDDEDDEDDDYYVKGTCNSSYSVRSYNYSNPYRKKKWYETTPEEEESNKKLCMTTLILGISLNLFDFVIGYWCIKAQVNDEFLKSIIYTFYLVYVFYICIKIYSSSFLVDREYWIECKIVDSEEKIIQNSDFSAPTFIFSFFLIISGCLSAIYSVHYSAGTHQIVPLSLLFLTVSAVLFTLTRKILKSKYILKKDARWKADALIEK